MLKTRRNAARSTKPVSKSFRTRNLRSPRFIVDFISIYLYSCQIWLGYAHFELRQLDVTMARKVLGTAIGKCPKKKLFDGYLEMELSLREFDR